MELKPTVNFRRIMPGFAIIFGAYAASQLLLRENLDTAIWSFAVCFALVLGLLPTWLTGSRPPGRPERHETREVHPTSALALLISAFTVSKISNII
jgi:hypothetical protein